LWGTVVGGFDANEAVQEKYVTNEAVQEKYVTNEAVTNEAVQEKYVTNEAVQEKYVDLLGVEDDILGGRNEDDIKKEMLEEEEVSNHCVHSCGGDDSMTASMTILSGPDTSSPPIDASVCEQDLDYRVGQEDGSLLTDEDTVTSVASEPTLCRGGAVRDADLEEHKFGPSPATNPGPPFKVGDVILCDIPGQLWGMDPKINWLQRGFIMQADDPNYKIRLEQGATVWTSRSESWLQSRWAMGPGTQFAEDVDDPFADLRNDPSL
jgi:hypothetical protein